MHLPLIMGKNLDGTTSKLSKRHGSVGFEDLVQQGYLPEAIVNYVALLGWCPQENREIFSLSELVSAFSVERICKSPAVFDFDKLNWFNADYIRAMPLKEFAKLAEPYFRSAIRKELDWIKVAAILQQRVEVLTQIPEMVRFLGELKDYDSELFVNKKSKTDLENSGVMLQRAIEELLKLDGWSYDAIHDCLIGLAARLGVKNGTVMWPVRIAASGLQVTPGGAIEILEILGKEESLKRLENGIKKLL